MPNRAERRKQQRETRGMYFHSEREWKNMVKEYNDGARRAALNQMQILWAAFLISAKEKLGCDTEQIDALQEEVKKHLISIETATELVQKCKELTGIDCAVLMDSELNGDDIADAYI